MRDVKKVQLSLVFSYCNIFIDTFLEDIVFMTVLTCSYPWTDSYGPSLVAYFYCKFEANRIVYNEWAAASVISELCK